MVISLIYAQLHNFCCFSFKRDDQYKIEMRTQILSLKIPDWNKYRRLIVAEMKKYSKKLLVFTNPI